MGNHNIVSVAATKGADCQTKGVGAHYKCTVTGCGKLFSDASGATETNDSALAGQGEYGEHSYGAWSISGGNHERSCETSGCTPDKQTHTIPTAAADKVDGCTECDKLTSLS